MGGYASAVRINLAYLERIRVLWSQLPEVARDHRRLYNNRSMKAKTSGLAKRRSVAEKKDRARYGEKRDKIISAAGPVLEKFGLQGTTIGAIAKAADVDRATVYYYFPDKFALFRAAIREGLTEMFQALDAVAEAEDAASDRLRRAIRIVMDVYERHYPYLYIYFQGGASSEILDQSVSAETMHSGVRYEELLLSIIQHGIDSGEFVEVLPPKITVNLIVGMLNWTYVWFRPKGQLTGQQIADGMTETILAGMYPRSAKPRARKPKPR
jgi:AcrR family transcriptional regulator